MLKAHTGNANCMLCITQMQTENVSRAKAAANYKDIQACLPRYGMIAVLIINYTRMLTNESTLA
jgi:hypothetical protein